MNAAVNKTRDDDPASFGGWHLDKRVPVAIIVTIFLQTFGVIWWAAMTQAQTNANTAAIASLTLLVAANDQKSQPLRDTVIEVATQVKMMSQTLDRQTTVMDRLSSQVAQIPGVKNN